MPRLAGLDMIIGLTPYGKFPMMMDTFVNMGLQMLAPMRHIKPVFPMPGGGTTQGHIEDVVKKFGADGYRACLEKAMPFKSQFRSFFLTPMMVPVASIVLVFQVLFNQNGVVNEFLKIFGADKIDWFKSDFAMIIVVILFLWKNLGYNMILFMAALAAVPRDVLEAAKMDGASDKQLFFRLKLKYISPTIFFVTIFSIINSFKVFREVYLLTGDYPYESLYMLQHFMNNAFNSLNYQRLSAAAILMSLVMVVIIGILFIAENRFGKDLEG